MSDEKKQEKKRKYPLVASVKDVDGVSDYPITSFVDQQTFDSARRYVPDSDDVFVCTFPKSGTTWMLYILHMLRGGCLEFDEGDNLSKYYACLDFVGAERTRTECPRPRLIQTHLRFDQMSLHDNVKYIFIARNVKDVLVSFFYHTLGFDFYHFAHGTFDDFFDHFVAGRHDYGDYFRMVAPWWEESKKRSNVHFLLYEDLNTDFESEVIKIAEFLGSDVRESLLANDGERLKKISEKAKIKSMKKSVKNYMARERPDDLPFIRKGVIGDWRRVMRSEQAEKLDVLLSEAAKHHPGFDRLWDSYQQYLR